MGIFSAVQGFEQRHPMVQHLLSLFSVDHLSETEKLATKFEEFASHLAGLLPDGQPIQDALTLLGHVQQVAVTEVARLEGATPDQLAALAGATAVTQATPAGGGYVITPAAPVAVAPLPAPAAAPLPVGLEHVATFLPASAVAAPAGIVGTFDGPVTVPVMPGADHPVWWPSPAGPGDAQPIADGSAADATAPAAPVAQAPAQPAAAPILPTLGQRLAAFSNTNPAVGVGGTGEGDSGPMGAGHVADATASA